MSSTQPMPAKRNSTGSRASRVTMTDSGVTCCASTVIHVHFPIDSAA